LVTRKLYAGAHDARFLVVSYARTVQGRPKPSAQIFFGAKYRASCGCCLASETLPRLQQPLLFQKPREHRQSHVGIVDLEHALLDRQRQRKDFSQPVPDPRGIRQCKIGWKALPADTIDQKLEQAREWLEYLGQRQRGFWRDLCHPRRHETIFGDLVGLHLEPT